MRGRRPRFVFNSDVTLRLATALWRHSVSSVGGTVLSAAGVRASFLVREDHLLTVPVRFFEDEWPTVRDLVAWGQEGSSFVWYPDAADDTGVLVELEDPAPGGTLAPEPDPSYPRVSVVALTFRRADGAPWDWTYFGPEHEEAVS